ncbi:hypothetical protein BDA99DRAFT_500368 [Phascolomyces articulosus]|uniref:Uncharacterized protein n=1 Tax=Phascolomyces articulosus TaxID=60185 RepID=A0AAD5PH76_9FUNG|nr:hypothetical protein BDA99DRAFT_500368 [Phascolomyces articulosus]
MSLDLVEQRFPMLVHATGQDLKQAPNVMANDIKGRIGTAIHRFRAPADAASNDMSRRMSLVIDNVEAVLDQYFPQEEGTPNDKKKKQQEQDMEDELIDPQDGQRLHVDDEGEEIQKEDPYSHSQLLRMYRIANSLSIRIAKRIAVQLDTTKGEGGKKENSEDGKIEQEQQAAAMMRLGGWLFSQTQQLVDHLDSYKSQLPEPVQAHVVQPMIDIAQKEYDILRQELDRKDISRVERARNMLAMSQDMVLMPLLQRSVESMRSHVVSYRSMAQQNRAQVMNELSTKVPFLANIAPMSAFASHHFSMNKKSDQSEGKKLNGVHISPNPEDNMMNPSSTTTAVAAEAC